MTAVQPAVKRMFAAALIVVILVAVGIATGRAMMSTDQLRAVAPTTAELQLAANTRVFFGHQSVGANVLSGLDALTIGEASGFRVIETRRAPAGTGGTIAHAHLGSNGDPQSKIDDFRTVMDAGMADAVDVALLKFCYVDVTAGTDVDGLMSAYTQAMTDLQRRHPNVTVLYATVPLTTARDLKATVKSWFGRDQGMGPEDNAARERFNAALRERFADSGLLFDIAAVEAGRDPGGDGRTSQRNGVPVLHDSFAADPGHLNQVGAQAAAAELVRTVAGAQGRP